MASATPRASLVVVADGRLLLVRSRGHANWALPGGKLEAGESPEQAVQREVGEELSVAIAPGTLRQIGFVAANGSRDHYDQTLFAGRLIATPRAGAEIEELGWFAPVEVDALVTSPMFRDRSWPAVRKHLQAISSRS
jgi:8-oxo-dGTP diphosphatase